MFDMYLPPPLYKLSLCRGVCCISFQNTFPAIMGFLYKLSKDLSSYHGVKAYRRGGGR